MATFGPIASSMPNVLYDAAAVDRNVQSFQRNQLLTENARQDQQYQNFDRDRQEVARVSASLLALPAEQRPAAYTTAVQQLQAQGYARRAPQQYPGDQQVEALARQGMTPDQQFSLVEKRRQSEAIMGMLGLGGGAGAMPGGATPASVSAPSLPTTAPAAVSGGSVRALNQDAAGLRREAMATLEGPALEARLAEISGGRAQAANGIAPGTPFRAAPGVDGAFAGLPAPTGAVPNLAGVQATPVSDGGAPARPVAPAAPPGLALLPNGLTREQVALVAAQAQSNPTGAIALMAQLRQQNVMVQERAGDNARAERQFTATQEQQRLTNERLTRTEEQRMATEARRAANEAEANRRADEDRTRRTRLDEEKARRDADPNAAATEAERKAAGFLERMQGAEEIVGALVRPTVPARPGDRPGEGYNRDNNRDYYLGSLPVAGNYLASEQGQRYMNAAAEWARAKLRLESGAAIGVDEARQEARTYFPMPGDSPQTIEQKRTLRETAMTAIRRQAGRALPRPPDATSAPDQGGATTGAPATAPAASMSAMEALAAARAKLGANASDDDLVAEAHRLRSAR